ncbi:MAG: ketoacyl-ACP synthase III [Clostridiales bacterium]|nr:ketoacyl-ACP synthase III [Clostridiales bacterium]
MRIIAMGSSLPERLLDNQELSRRVETSDEWITTRTGIRQRHIAREESTASLAAEAARRAMERAGTEPEQIGAVIVCTFTPDTATPSAACMVQRLLGLPGDVLAFDLNAACSGFVYGLAVAAALVDGPALRGRRALVIGAEVLSRLVDYTDRGTCILFGDGAGAAVAAPSDDPLWTDFGCDGNGEILCGGGYCPDGGRAPLTMNGREVFKFAVSTVPATIRRVLGRAEVPLDEVDHIVLHQANHRITEGVARHLGADPRLFFENIAHCGNTSAASIPLALCEMQDRGLLHRGQRVVLAGFGGGLTWGSMLLKW